LNRQYLINKIGSPLPPEKLVVEDQDAYDIMKRMLIKHKKCACDYDKIASEFEAQDIYQVCKKIWTFCKNNIAYDEESINRQEVSAPQTILKRGHSDCKGYALFIGGILDALNRQGWEINWHYRFASDDLFNETPGHVFVVVKDGLNEIWVDPVLSEFNQDHYFPYFQDKKISVSPQAVGRCYAEHKNAIGATASQTGQMIMKISPALAYIPVIGWVAAAAGEIIGGIISIVGSKWNQSPDVRWLIQLFEYYVKGNAGATSDNHISSEADTQPAQAFFSVVLGVPIGGRKDFNILQSGDGNTNTPTGLTPVQRAQNYLAFKNLAGSITLDQATQAAIIAGQLNPNGVKPGGWAGLVAAPAVIDKSGNTAPNLYVNQSGQLTNQSGSVVPSGNSNIILLAAGAAILFIILK
jgi:hypothetical protein